MTVTPVVQSAPPDATPEQLRHAVADAARALRTGGVVAFPTETVYGLGAHALDPVAVARLFSIKGRPADNPLIVHVADLEGARPLAASISPLAERLAAAFWPGPLTLVLEAAADVPKITTGGLSTVAVRAPAHPAAQELLRQAGVPTAAPSANLSGRPSPTTAAHVLQDFPRGIDYIVDGGPCGIGIESTVVDARGRCPIVLRPGSITGAMLTAALDVADGEGSSALGLPERFVSDAVSPGTRHAHYQPKAEVVVETPGAGSTTAGKLSRNRTVGYLGPPQQDLAAGITVLGPVRDEKEMAQLLYAALRRADDLSLDVVVVEAIPDTGLGTAVMDRIRRSAG